jgi:hypothetical protein
MELKYRNPGAPGIPPHPFSGCISGQSGSGKTWWVLDNLILSKDSPFDKIIWVAPSYSLRQPRLNQVIEAVNEVYPDKFATINGDDIGSKDSKSTAQINELLEANCEEGAQTLVVFDDLVLSATARIIGEMFIGGRHKNASTVELVQQLFAPGTRAHRINSEVFVIYRSGDKGDLRTLLNKKFEKEECAELMELYKSEMKGPHDWFMIDEKAGNSGNPEHQKLRIRTNKLNRVHPQYANS